MINLVSFLNTAGDEKRWINPFTVSAVVPIDEEKKLTAIYIVGEEGPWEVQGSKVPRFQGSKVPRFQGSKVTFKYARLRTCARACALGPKFLAR